MRVHFAIIDPDTETGAPSKFTPVDPTHLATPRRLHVVVIKAAGLVAEQNALGPICGCGCGRRIEVRPHHRRLDAEVFAGTPRAGVRFFAPRDVDTLRKVLDERRVKRKGSGAPDVAPETEGLSPTGTPRHPTEAF